MYKYILIVLLLLGLAVPVTATATTVSVAFINENPGETTLGLVKFKIVDGRKADYKLMNMRWTDEKKVINLEPGTYGVTQYVPEYDKIVSYQTFEVKDKPVLVKFRELF